MGPVVQTMSGTLTNAEVLQHVRELQDQYKREGRQDRIPKNLATTLAKVQAYLETPGGPLEPVAGNDRIRDPRTAQTLITRLRPYKIPKGETLQILNLRVDNRQTLESILEAGRSKLSDQQLDEITAIIREVLYGEDMALDDVDDMQVDKQAPAGSTSTDRKNNASSTASARNQARDAVATPSDDRQAILKALSRDETIAIPEPIREELLRQWGDVTARKSGETLTAWMNRINEFLSKQTT